MFAIFLPSDRLPLVIYFFSGQIVQIVQIL